MCVTIPIHLQSLGLQIRQRARSSPVPACLPKPPSSITTLQHSQRVKLSIQVPRSSPITLRSRGDRKSKMTSSECSSSRKQNRSPLTSKESSQARAPSRRECHRSRILQVPAPTNPRQRAVLWPRSPRLVQESIRSSLVSRSTINKFWLLASSRSLRNQPCLRRTQLHQPRQGQTNQTLSQRCKAQLRSEKQLRRRARRKRSMIRLLRSGGWSNLGYILIGGGSSTLNNNLLRWKISN